MGVSERRGELGVDIARVLCEQGGADPAAALPTAATLGSEGLPMAHMLIAQLLASGARATVGGCDVSALCAASSAALGCALDSGSLDMLQVGELGGSLLCAAVSGNF